jgi:hypothetical protein
VIMLKETTVKEGMVSKIYFSNFDIEVDFFFFNF